MSERTFFFCALNQKQRTSKRSAMCATSALSARSFDEAMRRRELRPSFVDGGVAAIGVVNAGNVPMSLLGEAGVKESSAAAAPLSKCFAMSPTEWRLRLDARRKRASGDVGDVAVFGDVARAAAAAAVGAVSRTNGSVVSGTTGEAMVARAGDAWGRQGAKCV